MQDLPESWLARPAPAPAAARSRFEALWAQMLALGPSQPAHYPLAEPKWQFLCHIAEHAGVVLHGSPDPAIAQFRPRRAHDTLEFGNRTAIYAATDGIWPMFYAILDRERHPMSLSNACLRIGEPGAWSEPRYFFSITSTALAQRPWRTGTVYALPARTFKTQPPFTVEGRMVQPAQAASEVPVRPLAKLTVAAQDFPFLGQVRGHDDRDLQERAAKDPGGFPAT